MIRHFISDGNATRGLAARAQPMVARPLGAVVAAEVKHSILAEPVVVVASAALAKAVVWPVAGRTQAGIPPTLEGAVSRAVANSTAESIAGGVQLL